MSDSTPLPGFCVRRKETVNEWGCKSCFWGDVDLRDEHRNAGGYPMRLSCVEVNIEAPRRRAEREAQVERLRPLLDRMDAGGFQGVVVNVLEAALAHPEEATARILLQQIETHAEYATSAQEPGPEYERPLCPCCQNRMRPRNGPGWICVTCEHEEPA